MTSRRRRSLLAKAAAVLLPVAGLTAILAVVLPPGGTPASTGAAAGRALGAAGRPAHATLRGSWFLGVREPGAPQRWAPVASFAADTQARPDIVLTYNGWRAPFPAAAARAAAGHHATLLVQMQPWGASLAKIARGGFDGYLHTFAVSVRDFRRPVILGFGHEMNGPWYPWGAGHAQPAQFVAAWRHIVTLFRKVGADNVTWLWTTHHTRNAANLRAYWPGSRYVTWVGIDGYYEFRGSSFSRVFGSAATAVRTITRKPILISETSVGPGAGRVPGRIARLFAGARREHFIGLVWFDVSQHDPPYHQNWRLENRPAALAAFRRAAATPRSGSPLRAGTVRTGTVRAGQLSARLAR